MTIHWERKAKAVVGLRPSFSSHVRWGERGAPVDSRRRFPHPPTPSYVTYSDGAYVLFGVEAGGQWRKIGGGAFPFQFVDGGKKGNIRAQSRQDSKEHG